MPVEIRISTEEHLITYIATGEITIEEMKAAFDSVFDHPDFRSGMNALCDAKYASFPSVGLTQIKDLIGALELRSSERGRDYRVAILVRGNLEFGVSSLFEMHAYGMPFEVAVFRNSTDAREWLGVHQPDA